MTKVMLWALRQLYFYTMNNEQLINKYNVAGPRYTSYPTVPAWNLEDFNLPDWQIDIKKTFQKDQNIGIYIHLPYCESLCTFCACHKHITINHSVEGPYIEALLKEWQLYLSLFDQKPVLKELHLGGGTPSFFSPENLKYLIENLLSEVTVPEDAAYGFEGHPMNTTREHLEVLHALGFNRVSFGVQDYDAKVQQAINRHQPFEKVKKITEIAREIGYTSISHDLVYGLPFQTIDGIKNTVEKTLSLKPDRLSFYSYAHVPWIKGNGQRGFSEENLPGGPEKRALYELGKKLFEKAGYEEVGMDHFAKPSDELFIAREEGRLHRNFMGYTTENAQTLIGLGVSAIGNSATTYFQNDKVLKTYLEKLQNGKWPVVKGHLLTEKEVLAREIIEDIMCNFHTKRLDVFADDNPEIYGELRAMEQDGILTFNQSDLWVKEPGKAFVRNIAMLFDEHLKKDSQKPLFSKTI
ncbi:oxygen-independent coproporphyrinogen III oxidase [Jiulongibacter sediminis]|jgi:oxygen-independent coproporphyrinogen-3 oxidase|uniref:oxygen-independent coproporphyrinogen III oxidase n=1 Tax=Jiulongibacter sediminis TaxID=1605367 RepID=UPI0026ED77A1|nr:oxygen-independent coproporphyrinogen III oxidase [Jiulongibacter sediminis]